MKMITKIFNSICSTDSLPVLGGAGGALSQTHKIIEFLPTWETYVSAMIITISGAILGYFIKILLDKVFNCKKKP